MLLKRAIVPPTRGHDLWEGCKAMHIERREFITLVGSAAAWPLAARAQQAAMPVIGLLSPRAPGDDPQLLTAFGRGLKDAGFVEGQNVDASAG